MKEIWKPVPGYEQNYEASNLGRIRSLPRNGTVKYKRIMKPKKTRHGYLDIVLQKDGHRRYRHLHQVIAETFIPNPDDKPQVNHKDGDKTNNNADNLEWNTASENLRHKFRVLGRKASRHGMKPVRCVETGILYDSINSAARSNNCDRSQLKRAICGQQNIKTAGGYHWKYETDWIDHKF